MDEVKKMTFSPKVDCLNFTTDRILVKSAKYFECYVIGHIKSDQKDYLLDHISQLLQIASFHSTVWFVNSFRCLDKGTHRIAPVVEASQLVVP